MKHTDGLRLHTHPESLNLKELRAVFDTHLERSLMPLRGKGDRVGLAVREGLLGPGKRIRPMLMLVAGQCFGQPCETLLDAAVAVEMVHTASLFLDDLPCMDDASERRGRPALHLQFGEDVAVLASVALLSQAFRMVSACEHLHNSSRNKVITALADAVGPMGLVQGQDRDLRADTAGAGALDIAGINDLKTGSLFRFSLTVPAIAAKANARQIDQLNYCASEIGQAFQLRDDLEDDASQSGGISEDANRLTLVGLLGIDFARGELEAHLHRATLGLRAALPASEPLISLLRQLTPAPRTPLSTLPLHNSAQMKEKPSVTAIVTSKA